MRISEKSEARHVLIATAVLILATAFVMLYGGASAGDDTFIYMRYIQNALSGHGFTFNPDEPSYGCTSALWIFVMKPIAIIAGNSVWTWKISSSVLFGLRASVLYLFVSRFRIGTAWSLLLTIVVVAEPHSLRWGSSGMENSLAVLLLTVTAYLFWLCAEEPSTVRIIAMAVVSGLLPFARPEFATISVAISVFAFFVIKNLRFAITLWVIEFLIALLMTGLVWFCFGALLPQSAQAKAVFLQHDHRYDALLQCGKSVLTGCICPFVILVVTKGISSAAKYWRLATIICFAFAVGYLGYRNHLVSTRYASYICAPIILAAVIVVAETVAATAKQSLYVKGLLVAHIAISIAVLVYLFPATRAADYKDIKNVADAVAAK